MTQPISQVDALLERAYAAEPMRLYPQIDLCSHGDDVCWHCGQTMPQQPGSVIWLNPDPPQHNGLNWPVIALIALIIVLNTLLIHFAH